MYFKIETTSRLGQQMDRLSDDYKVAFEFYCLVRFNLTGDKNRPFIVGNNGFIGHLSGIKFDIHPGPMWKNAGEKDFYRPSAKAIKAGTDAALYFEEAKKYVRPYNDINVPLGLREMVVGDQLYQSPAV